MSVDLSVQEGSQAIAGPATGTIAMFMVSSAGDDNSVTEWDPGSDALVPATLGYGTGPELLARKIRIAGVRTLAVKVHASTVGAVGAVTHHDAAGAAGTGPTVTVAGAAHDDLSIVAKVDTAGANGAAKVKIALDGVTYGGPVDVPALLPATIRGTVDLTTITLADLATKTFIVTVDGGSSETTTFTSPTDVDDIIDQINATGDAVAKLISGKYLQIEGVDLGAPGTLDVGSGTANTLLGFAADPASVTGTNSTITVENTGVTFTFPAGTYKAGETYAVEATGPRYSISDFNTAADALRASGIPFEGIEICQDPVDGADVLAWANAAEAKLSSWHTADVNRIFPWYLIGTSLGTAGSPSANDTDVRTAMNGDVDKFGIIPHGDIYATGSEYVGSFRRSLRVPLGEIMAGNRASQDPGFGGLPPLPQCSAKSPDGATRARDEALATVKMQDARFTTMIVENQRARIKAGATRAAATSKLAFPGVLRAAYLAATTVYQRLVTFENADFTLNSDGTLREDIAAAIEKGFDADLQTFIVDQGHASRAKSKVDTTKVADSQGKYPLTITYEVQIKGQVRSVKGTVSLVSGLSLVAA